MTKLEKISLMEAEVKQAEVMVGASRAQLTNWEQLLDLRREVLSTLGVPIDMTSSGGHVYDQAKTDEGWKPDQTGGVVTAEPDSVVRAQEAGERFLRDSGGDMKL